MIHIYCGDGKGKTTCAFGLALRAAGRGFGVAVAQFLKSADSGEREALAHIPEITLLPVPAHMKFAFTMTDRERLTAAEESAALLARAACLMEEEGCGMVILDEICGAVSTGMVELETLLAVLDRAPRRVEVVLTGRDPDPALLERADYVTEMKKIKHPFDRGIAARRGVEW